jgi:hypothetical protein
MAAKTKKDDEPKRLNRVVGAGEALQKALDPVFRKRGFASRDLIAHWAAMAPQPYNRIAVPDRLVWPRNAERQAGGATLYLRCAEGHALALQHEAPLIAKAVNRYFGYLLVSTVRLSASPFSAPSGEKPDARRQAPAPDAAVDAAVKDVRDDGLRDALRRLGRAIKSQNN